MVDFIWFWHFNLVSFFNSSWTNWYHSNVYKFRKFPSKICVLLVKLIRNFMIPIIIHPNLFSYSSPWFKQLSNSFGNTDELHFSGPYPSEVASIIFSFIFVYIVQLYCCCSFIVYYSCSLSTVQSRHSWKPALLTRLKIKMFIKVWQWKKIKALYGKNVLIFFHFRRVNATKYASLKKELNGRSECNISSMKQ